MKFSFTLPSDREFDVVGFGLNAIDHLVTIPRFPSFNTKVRLTDHRQMSGGQVSSAMVGARRLGLRASYIGKVGYDNEGRMLIESLQKEGVDCGGVMIAMGAKTQGAVIIIEQFSGERTILWYHDDGTRVAPEEQLDRQPDSYSSFIAPSLGSQIRGFAHPSINARAVCHKARPARQRRRQSPSPRL